MLVKLKRRKIFSLTLFAEKYKACETLWICILTSIRDGLTSGGGIGVVLRRPHPLEPKFLARSVYDLAFFFILIVIVLNLIFGVIIDTFADLRNEKQQREDILHNSCFICGNFLIFDHFYKNRGKFFVFVFFFQGWNDLDSTIKQFLSNITSNTNTTCGIICTFTFYFA